MELIEKIDKINETANKEDLSFWQDYIAKLDHTCTNASDIWLSLETRRDKDFIQVLFNCNGERNSFAISEEDYEEIGI